MILGNICTRSCGFCNVVTGKPRRSTCLSPARGELGQAHGVKHAVITSVDRDDLPDGGAEIWAQTVRAIRHQSRARPWKRSSLTSRKVGQPSAHHPSGARGGVAQLGNGASPDQVGAHSSQIRPQPRSHQAPFDAGFAPKAG